MEYTVLGDTVNTAARIESTVATPDQVSVGETTYQRTKDIFDYTHLGKFKVKGKAKAISVYTAVPTLSKKGLIY